MIWLILIASLTPAVAFAANGDGTTGSLVLQSVTLAVSVYIASGIGALRDRVANVERRVTKIERGEIIR